MRPAAPLVLILLGATFAGCVAPAGGPLDRAGDAAAKTPWEGGLASFLETPPHVKTRDDAARREGVRPAGSPDLAAIDAFVTAYMNAHLVGAAQIAIQQDGALLYERGFGHVDEARTTAADETTMFRLASVTKPMTRMLVHLQVEQGLYNLTDPVFCLPPTPAPGCRLPIAPHPAHPVVDPRVANVTVEHLLAHQGGWGRSTDWMYRGPGTHDMATTLGVDLPLPAWRAAQYLLGEEIVDDPGTTTWYCNMCYVLAGLVAEAATGVELQALYDAYLFRPLSVSGEIELARALPEDRNPREPNYACGSRRPSAYDPDKEVCGPDGGFSTEIVSSAGGLVATAAAVAAVYEAYPELVPEAAYRVNNVDVSGAAYEWRGHGGLLDGTAAQSSIVRDRAGAAGTMQFVVLFNSHRPATLCGGIDQEPLGRYTVGCSMDYFEQGLTSLVIARGALTPALG